MVRLRMDEARRLESEASALNGPDGEEILRRVTAELEMSAPSEYMSFRSASDQGGFFESLDERAKKLVMSWREKELYLMDKHRASLIDDARRRELPQDAARPFTTFRVSCPCARPGCSVSAELRVWEAPLCSQLAEGKHVILQRVTVSSGSSSNVVLSTSRLTRFAELVATPDCLRLAGYKPRNCARLGDLLGRFMGFVAASQGGFSGDAPGTKEVDLAAALICHKEDEATGTCTLCLMDTSSSVLFLEARSRGSVDHILNAGQLSCWSLMDVTITRYDDEHSVLVGRWTERTSGSAGSGNAPPHLAQAYSALQSWVARPQAREFMSEFIQRMSKRTFSRVG